MQRFKSQLWVDCGLSLATIECLPQPQTDIYQQAVVTRFARARGILVISNNHIKSCGLAIKRRLAFGKKMELLCRISAYKEDSVD